MMRGLAFRRMGLAAFTAAIACLVAASAYRGEANVAAVSLAARRRDVRFDPRTGGKVSSAVHRSGEGHHESALHELPSRDTPADAG
jgi:hypothetical protein